MIDFRRVNNYCKDDISLIENYEEAVNSPVQWDCHHRLEIELNLSAQELIDRGLYYNRPYTELIFLSHGEHSRLHNLNLRLETINKRSNSKKGVNNPIYGKQRPEETKNKISETMKGNKQSEETKRKRSESLKIYWDKKRQSN